MPVAGARVVELGEAVILPGLVNVHGHPELTVLRGRIEEGYDLMDALLTAEGKLAEVDVRLDYWKAKGKRKGERS